MSVADATRPLREVVTIGVADPSVRLRSPQTTTVTVQIVPGGTSRVFTKVPVTVRNLDNGSHGRVTPASVTVTLHGTRSVIRDLSPELVAAEVDAAGRQPGEYQADVQVHSVQGVSVDDVTPRAVRLRVTKQ